MPDYTQRGRPIRIDTPLGEDALLLERFHGRESVSAPFLYHARAVSTERSLDIEGLLRKPALLSVERPDQTYRTIHGLVRSARMLELDKGLVTYRLEIVPWLWFLTQCHDCRIFQNKAVPEILEAVFTGRGYPDYRFELQSSYEPRAYCVQYRETDFNFVSRLMEEEGIFYFFEHTDSRHVLVIADSPAAVKACPGQASVRFAHPDGLSGDTEDYIHTVDLERAYHTGKVTLQDFDFMKPSTDLTSSVSGVHAESESYDYPGAYYTKARGEKISALRLEMEEWPGQVIRGTSGCRALESGYKFELAEHFRGDLNAAWMVLAVEHSAEGGDYRSEEQAPFKYSNRYEAIPATVRYRPPVVSPRPTIKGTQTGIVVGPAGEEIYVDKYGRVKVHFHWDRVQPSDETASCWVRVSQPWAGGAWGWITIPRIGQEVVISFMEGDPDRPLITGRVYNEAEQVPYQLPDHSTISTWRSRSTKGGGASNFNEIRMEDLKGAEQLFLHAEMDRDDRTKRHLREAVGGDRHLSVDGVRKEHVKGANHVKVDAQQSEDIGGKYSLKVGGDHHTKVATNHAVDAGMEIHLKAGMKVIVESGVQLTLKGPGGFVNIDPSGVQIQGNVVLINSGGAAGAGSGAKPDAPEKPDLADDGSKRGKL